MKRWVAAWVGGWGCGAVWIYGDVGMWGVLGGHVGGWMGVGRCTWMFRWNESVDGRGNGSRDW